MTALPYRTIGAVGAMLRRGEVTSRALTELILERIEAYNPALNAFITVTADAARAGADRADAELADGIDRGALHGVPVAVKDIFDTRGVRTTHGSKLFEDNVPDRDATAVRRLGEAGAVLLGKTGMHELAYGNTSINPWFGAIGNPWRPDHDPGGSSGGSAAAVAAGLAYAALGTDTGCSIHQPAHCCGIVGFKPSFGTVSKAGVFPLAWSLDHVGPLVRSVGDARIVHAALAGPDPADPYTGCALPDRSGPGVVASLTGVRIGVSRRFFFEGHDDVIGVVDAALAELEARGAVLVPLDIADAAEAHAAAGATFAEAVAIHARDLAERPECYSDELHAKLAEPASPLDYVNAQHFRRGFVARVDRLMDTCDALAAPTATIAAAPIAERPADYGRNAWKNCGIFNLTGQPSISVPCGFTPAGLPVGLMLTGRRYADAALLGLAEAVERATDWRRTPPI